jgi:hypothetical protein
MIGVDHEPPLIQQMQHLCVPSEFTDACNQAELGIEGELEAGNVLRLSDLQQVRTPRYRVGGVYFITPSEASVRRVIKVRPLLRV